MFRALRKIGDHIEDVVQLVILLPSLIDEAKRVIEAIRDLVQEIRALRERQAPPVPMPPRSDIEQNIISDLQKEIEELREEK
jgi:hypothetical protein